MKPADARAGPVDTTRVAPGIPRIQRRLSALEAAAATAVIITSLTALAVLTGVMPGPLTATPQMPPAVAQKDRPGNGGATTAIALPDSNQVSGGVPAASSLAAPQLNSTEVVPPVATAAASTAGTAGFAAPPPDSGPVPAAGLQSGLPFPAAVQRQDDAMTGKRPGLARAETGRNRREAGNRRQTARAAVSGKSRQQVIAELLEAKRNGTYDAAADTYR